jgi:hypothetical protein
MPYCNVLNSSGLEDNWDITLLHPKFFVVQALEGVTFYGPKRDITRDICSGICSGAVDDMIVTGSQIYWHPRVDHYKLMNGAKWMVSGTFVIKSMFLIYLIFDDGLLNSTTAQGLQDMQGVGRQLNLSHKTIGGPNVMLHQ